MFTELTGLSAETKSYFLKRFFLILISLLLITIHIHAQNGWTLKSYLPTPRVGASAEIINGEIYIMGGNGGPPDFPSLTVTEMYDPITNKWEQKAPMLTPRGFFASGMVNDTIYVMGGGYSYALDEVEVYDPVINTWASKANMLNPRLCMRGAVVDGIIYIFGGNYNERNVQAYDPATNKWTEKTPIPPDGGGNLSVTAYNNELIYVFGGTSNPSPSVPYQPLSTVYEYYPKTDTWTKRKDMPTPRFGFQTCTVNGKIYAIGGSQARNTALATVEVYDPATDTWETQLNMPISSFDFAAAVVDNKIYVISGSPDWATSDGAVWEYDPVVYLTIIYAKNLYVNKLYARTNIDSVLFRTRFSNVYDHQFTPHLIYANLDSTQIDSLTLYDDGMHGDSSANDGMYAIYLPPRPIEDFYSLSVSTIESQTQNYFIVKDKCRFTTAGPVVLDSVSYRRGLSNYHYIRPFVHNLGMNKTIPNAALRIICNDPWIASLGSGSAAMPNIAPDSSVSISTWITISVIDSLFPGYFNFKAEIISDGYVYWVDSMKLNVITGVEEELVMPSAFKLEQNYPCPFNSSTKISWQTPVISWQTIKIFDVLGNEVATLVNEYKPAGNYEIEFNVSKLSSGVYFYRLQVGSFIETKKMILMK